MELLWLYERYNVPNASGGMTKCRVDHFGRDVGKEGPGLGVSFAFLCLLTRMLHLQLLRLFSSFVVQMQPLSAR